jgi:MSHA biogenesis protein MshE
MPAAMLTRFRDILGRSSGMVLVTGPTGSGKTTTLYAALAEIDAEEHKIITVEDPVEYRLPGLSQVQVNEKIELTFARVLRATLRQDPDVILVGEMRDPETAEIGLRGAMTGHLVLSTLHTRDAISTPFRLLDMGVPAFMVATSLQAVIAQRLVRCNCEQCNETQNLSPQQQAWLEAALGERAAPVVPKRGRGCSACNNTGYHGRAGVYEMLEMDSQLTHAATHADPNAFLAAARQRMQGHTMMDHALELVRLGKTSVAEAMRIASDIDVTG